MTFDRTDSDVVKVEENVFKISKDEHTQSLFDEADSAKNIIFMEQKEGDKLQNELDPNAATITEPQIKAANLYKLIERITSEKYSGVLCC